MPKTKKTVVTPIDIPKNPVLAQHLKIFRYFGGTPLVVEVGRFSEVSKPFLTATSVFLVVHVAFFAHYLTDVKTAAPFTSALTVFRRSVFGLGPVIALYKTLKHRLSYGVALDELVAIQQTFGMTRYKVAPSLVAFGVSSLLTSSYRLGMGAMSFAKAGKTSSAFNQVESVFLNVYIAAALVSFNYVVACVSSCIRHLSNFGLKQPMSESTVRRYVQIYTHLVDISEKVNGHFDASISFCVLSLFLNMMDVCSELMINEDLNRVGFVWQLLKLVISLQGILLLVETCQSAIDEAEKCNVLLYSRLIQLNSLPSENNIHSLAMMHLGAEKSIRYKLCDSFTINYHLAISMTAAFVTYVTVMFQIDSATPTIVDENANSLQLNVTS